MASSCRRILGRALDNRLKALITGLGVTTVLQSSTATGLMVSSFAANGLIALAPALAVMLGANIGTTLIAQALSFDISELAPLLLLAGVAMFRSSGARTRDFGRVAIGLALMVMALSRLMQIVTPYEDVPSLRILMGAIATDPIISIVFGLIITWAAHSSVAVVLLVMSFVAKGVVPLNAGIALVIGANIGTALNPLLEGSRSGEMAGRRVAIGNLATRLIAAALLVAAIPWVGARLAQHEPNLSRAVRRLPHRFQRRGGVGFLAVAGPAGAPPRAAVSGSPGGGRPVAAALSRCRGDRDALIALGHASREALRMVDALEGMLETVSDAFRLRDREAFSKARRMDDVLDALNREIKRYLTSLDPESLTDDEHQRLEAILTFAFHLESAGDVVERNIAAFFAKQLKRGVDFTLQTQQAIGEALDAVRANLRVAASIFTTGDARAARLLAEQKSEFRRREAEALKAQIAQLRDSKSAASAPPVDLLRDLKRLNDHLVSGAAYPVLEAGGQLMASRMTPDG